MDLNKLKFTKQHFDQLKKFIKKGVLTPPGWRYAVSLLISQIVLLPDLELRTFGSHTIKSHKFTESIFDSVIRLEVISDKLSIDREKFPSFSLHDPGIFSLYDQTRPFKFNNQAHWGYLLHKRAFARITISALKEEQKEEKPTLSIHVEEVSLEKLIQTSTDGMRIYKIFDFTLAKHYEEQKAKMDKLSTLNKNRELVGIVVGAERYSAAEE